MLRSKYQNLKSKNLNPMMSVVEPSDFACLPARQGFRISSLALSGFIMILGFSILSFAQQEFKYDAKGKRNPFIPLVTSDGRLLKLEQEEGVGGLLLQGIIYDKHGLSYAVVNDQIVKIGDKVNDYQVLKIEKNKIIFIKEGQATEVELKEEKP